MFIQSVQMKRYFRVFYGPAGADDKPLRMVKTVLYELVKLRGAAIKGHISMALAAARMLTASGPGGGGPNHWSDSAANNSASVTHSGDAQLKVEAEISTDSNTKLHSETVVSVQNRDPCVSASLAM
ncbi:protein MOR1 [Trifolium repens]|nr:protein MOR1 [Trifolium repens]